jgi:diguanylate cyclase (GGDEF)-like protein
VGVPPRHPFARPGLARRALPFAGALAVAFAAVPLVRVTRPDLLLAAAALALGTVVAVARVDWERLPRALASLPPLATVAVVLLREATGGLEEPVDFEVLLLLPVVWVALYGTRGELLVTSAAGGATFVVSLLQAPLVDGSWVTAILWPGVATLLGLRVQGLVRQVTVLSRTDGLTGVANRLRWEEELAREVRRAERSGRPLAIGLIDLDRFKRFNDDQGHGAGDALLHSCAQAWAGRLRGHELLARYGGEEFGVLLPEADVAEAHEVAERLRAACPPAITCSVGIAIRQPGEDAAHAVERADRALYRAKAAGRDRIEVDLVVAQAPVAARAR